MHAQLTRSSTLLALVLALAIGGASQAIATIIDSQTMRMPISLSEPVKQ